jgi:hypothetical protein
MRCPRCSSEDTEQVDDIRWFCDATGCRFVFTPEPTPRLIDPPERERRDLA